MKKYIVFFLIFVSFFSFFGSSVVVFARESIETPSATGTFLDIHGADPGTFRTINNINTSAFGFLNWLLDYARERFWAIWDWFIEFLKAFQPWYTNTQGQEKSTT